MPANIVTIDHALPDKICEDFIRKFDSDPQVQPDPQPEYSKRIFLYLSDKPEWMNILIEIQAVADKLVKDYFSYPEPYAESARHDWFDDGYVLAHYRPGEGCALHDDGQVAGSGVRLATLLFFLNTAKGGETVFPAQKVSITPQQGRAVLFPPTLRYPHFVPPTKSDRYILQTWIIDPTLEVVAKEVWD